MNINWGTGIALFFTAFVVIMVTAVIRTTYHGHSLVTEKYYEADLAYQTQFDKLANTQSLAEDLSIKYDLKQRMLLFHFPSDHQQIEGTIVLFKPDNQQQDQVIAITTDQDNVLTIPTHDFPAGRWRIKVDWQDDRKAYYKEVNLTL